MDTNGAEESVLVSEVSSFQKLKVWYLGWEKVSCLERCPQFRGVPIEEFHCTCIYILSTILHYVLCAGYADSVSVSR